MEEDHPRKRRKTSPLTSVTLNQSHTQTRAASEDGSRSTPARASFMSPTKASLARFNPQLLRPFVSAESNQQVQASGQSHIFGDKQQPDPYVGKAMVNDVSIAPQEKSQPVGARIDPRESIKEEATSSVGFDTAPKANESHSSLRRSQTPLVEPPNSKQFQAIGGQDSRALPPEAAGETEKILSDTVPIHNASGHQASIAEHMNSTIDTIENEIEQPDGPDAVLPFTPTKNVLKDAEPRLPSTPSQLGLEAPPSPPKGLPSNIPKQKLDRKKRSKLKSSTLKPVAPSTAMKPVQTPYVSGLGPRILVTPTQQSKMTQSKGRVNDADRLAAPNSNPFVDVSRRPSSLSQRLALFLPFSGPSIPDSDTPRQNLNRQKEAGALHIDAAENTIPSATSNDSTLQHQDVVFTSPQQLLVVKFELNTDKATQKNTDLTVTSISPWAISELGQWLQTEAVQLDKPAIEQAISRYWELSEIRASCWHRCEQDLKQKAITGDSTYDPSSEEQQDTTSLPTKLNPARQQTPSLHPFPDDPVPKQVDNSNINDDPSPKAQPISRGSLHQHIGQQSILFSRSSTTSLLITWRLTISPAGAVHSNLSAHATFPDAWTQAPGGEALGKVGEAFDLLILEVGVFRAVNLIWGLIFGT